MPGGITPKQYWYAVGGGESGHIAVDPRNPDRIFAGTCNKMSFVYFDAMGVPWCIDPQNVRADQFDFTLTLGGHSRRVELEGVTGRVTVQ